MAADGLKRFRVFGEADDNMEVDWEAFDNSCHEISYRDDSQDNVTDYTGNNSFGVEQTKVKMCHDNSLREDNQCNVKGDNLFTTKLTELDNCFNIDEDSGLGMEETVFTALNDTVFQNFNSDRPFAAFSSSLSGSRSTGSLQGDESAHAPSDARITRAVDKLSNDPDLVADGSRAASLPIVPSQRKEMMEISAQTLATVLRGYQDEARHHVTVIDCRYPYEYNGGHIKGALNLYTRQQLKRFLQHTPTSDRLHILVFHCEFSSQRGPNMYRYLRTCDRELHEDVYPHLTFPEMYLLQGGYKAFFQQHKDLCEPQHYTPMSHSQHGKELRHFRVKSKSCPPASKSWSSLRDSFNVTKLTYNELS